MAQRSSRTGGQVRPQLDATNLAVAVAGTGNTQLLELNTLGLSRIAVHIDVTVHALDSFAILGRMHPGAAFDALYNTAGGFTSPVGILVAASGDLTSQAVGAGWFLMDVAALDAVRVTCSGAADGTLVDAYASGS